MPEGCSDLPFPSQKQETNPMRDAPFPQPAGDGAQGPCHNSPRSPSAAPVSQSLAHNHLLTQSNVLALRFCHLLGASFPPESRKMSHICVLCCSYLTSACLNPAETRCGEQAVLPAPTTQDKATVSSWGSAPNSQDEAPSTLLPLPTPQPLLPQAA